MKKLNFMALFSLMLVGLSAQATDMFIKMEIFPSRKQKIFNEIVSHSGLAKPSEDNYHLTLAQITDAKGSAQGKKLKKFLLGELNEACKGSLDKENAIILKDVSAGRYTVNRKYNNCPIVLLTDEETGNILKNYNLILNKALAKFNTKYETNFKMGDDLVPANYTPHITLADTSWINSKCQHSRDEIIGTLNKKITQAKQKNKKPTYDFKLIVPQVE
jgi:hypothetical protein